MAAMERTDENAPPPPAAVRTCLGAAALFEALAVFATQDQTVRAASPWQEDPYHVLVSLAEVAVPLLALLIAVRLLLWRAPGGEDRVRQTTRAAGVMTTLIAITLVFEWAAVIVGADAASWNAWTPVLIGGLVACSASAAIATVLLVRRRPCPSPGRWRHDWLGDLVLVGARIPVVRLAARPDGAAWVRRRAMTVFVALSVLAAAAVTASQAVGERLTDPLLIAWFLTIGTARNFAFCLIGNAVAGFVARPPRSPARRAAEASVVVGCVAALAATAFRDPIWRAFGAGPLTSVPTLVAFTLGTGLAASALAAVPLLARTRPPKPPLAAGPPSRPFTPSDDPGTHP